MCRASSVDLGLEGNDEKIKGQNDCDQATVTWGGVSWFLFRELTPCSSRPFNLLGQSQRAREPDRPGLGFQLYRF